MLHWEQGTNVTVNASFDDCDLPLLATWLSGPKHLNSLLTCVFHAVGFCNVLFYASNAVSRANASALVISEVATQGFNLTLECQSRYPSCFQNDVILLYLSLTNGTHPKFVFDMGNDTIFTSANKSYAYSFALNGTFDLNITAYNNVSSKSVTRAMKIVELLLLIGAYLYCNKTVGLTELTVCNLGVKQGTAFQCWLNMGDKAQKSDMYYTYVNLTTSLRYNYTSYGIFTVTFICSTQSALTAPSLQRRKFHVTLK